MLGQLIAQHAQTEFDSGDDDAVAKVLNARSVIVSDATLYTSKKLVEVLGDLEAYRLVAGTIAAAAAADPLVADAQGWLRSSGIDFSDPKTQKLIDQLAAVGKWPDDVRDRIKAIGIQTVSPASQLLGRDVTAGEIVEYRKASILSAARAAIAAATNDKLARLDTLDVSEMSVDDVRNFVNSIGA
jgi:hypothetical protein